METAEVAEFDPQTIPEYLKRLRTAMDWSREKLKPYREKRLEVIRQFVGKHYSEAGAADRVPVNFIEQAVQIYLRHLAANNPHVLVSVEYRELKPFAAKLELAVNTLLKKIFFDKTMRAVARDALFSIGIAKMGLEVSGSVEVDGVIREAGQPFVDVVDLDNFVVDMAARRWSEVRYMGDKYRVSLKAAKENTLFNENRRFLKATQKTWGDEDGTEKAESIGQSARNSDHDEYEDFVELWDIYLPRENKILVMDADQGIVLREEEWSGPRNGPYKILGFEDVPTNLMPLPPVANWRDLHELMNVLFRKLGRQAERQKDVTLVRRGAEADGKRIQSANDGDIYSSDDPKNVFQAKFGGIDANNMAFLMQVRQLASYHAGNLDSLGGLAPQADTVGQENLISQSASKRMSDMQDQMTAFTTECIEGLAQMLFSDPLIELPMTRRIPGTDVDIQTSYTANDQVGDFFCYNFKVRPFSMQEQTPQSKLQNINMLFQNYIMPFAAQLQQNGMGIDFERLLRLIAKYSNMDELEEILTFGQEPNRLDGGPHGDVPAKVAATTRRYERINRPGASMQGQEAAMMQSLMGGNPQPAEMASVGRPVA